MVTRYRLYLLREKGSKLDITGAVESLGWEEGENEISCRISLGMHNALYQGGRISALLKPGCLLLVEADSGEGFTEVVRGYIVDHSTSVSSGRDSLDITAYDELYYLQQSHDNRYITKGTNTKSALESIFRDWNIPTGIYRGPKTAHAKTLFKNEYLGKIILELLDTAGKQDGNEYIIRASSGKVDILPVGGNTTVYALDAAGIESVTDRFSTQNLVTRVKIVGKEDSRERQAVEAVVNGKEEYGIRQKIHNLGEDSLAAAKKAAEKILKEEGSPKRTATIEAADVPSIRKGDKINVKYRSRNACYLVKSIRHNADDGRMTIELGRKIEQPEKQTAAAAIFQKGDSVILDGYVYNDSYGNNRGKEFKNHCGTISLKVDVKRACPYHVDSIGWVHAADMRKA